MQKYDLLVRWIAFVLCFHCGTWSASVSLANFPKDFQLYPRDNQDSALIAFDGTVADAPNMPVFLDVFKNNIRVLSLEQAPAATGNFSTFHFTPKIHAELAMYRFEIRVDGQILATADSVVSGDAFLVDGQSNSCDISADAPEPFVRTYGQWCNGACTANLAYDTTWSLAHRPGHEANGWGRRIAKSIVDQYHIPICVITGGQGATNIQFHAPSTDPGTLYGRYRDRIYKAQLANGIKWVVWDQGEANPNEENYKKLFSELAQGWKADFPGIRHYYMFQIRPGCDFRGLETVREQQRQLSMERGDLSIMSTTNAPSHDGCHYGTAGYQKFAEWMYPLIARDNYGFTASPHLLPPNLLSAQFSNREQTQVELLFEQAVFSPNDPAICHAFTIGDGSTPVDSVKSNPDAHTVAIYLHAQANAPVISYVPDTWNGIVYEGPWLSNSLGIGPLAFFQNPIRSYASVDLISRNATVTASSELDPGSHKATNVNDGVLGLSDKGEWASKGESKPWIRLSAGTQVAINKIVLYDRVSPQDNILSATLRFSDNTSVHIADIPPNGAAKEVTFSTKIVTWVQMDVEESSGSNIGLSEFEVYRDPSATGTGHKGKFDGSGRPWASIAGNQIFFSRYPNSSTRLTLVSVQGQRIFSKDLAAQNASISIPLIPPGLYILTLENGHGMSTQFLMK